MTHLNPKALLLEKIRRHLFQQIEMTLDLLKDIERDCDDDMTNEDIGDYLAEITNVVGNHRTLINQLIEETDYEQSYARR